MQLLNVVLRCFQECDSRYISLGICSKYPVIYILLSNISMQRKINYCTQHSQAKAEHFLDNYSITAEEILCSSSDNVIYSISGAVWLLYFCSQDDFLGGAEQLWLLRAVCPEPLETTPAVPAVCVSLWLMSCWILGVGNRENLGFFLLNSLLDWERGGQTT